MTNGAANETVFTPPSHIPGQLEGAALDDRYG